MRFTIFFYLMMKQDVIDPERGREGEGRGESHGSEHADRFHVGCGH